MKKLLSLLSVLTIIENAVSTTVATSPYQKENKKLLNSEFNNLKRVKRNDPSSLQDIITTINIGEISNNSENTIISALRQLNNPILLLDNFINSIIFINITNDHATFRLSRDIRFGEEINSIISSNIIFTVNFNLRFNLREIINNTNFQNIPNNNPQTILNEVISRYPILNSVRQNLRILRTSPRNAYIYTNNINYFVRNYDSPYSVLLTLNENNNVTNLQNIRDIITNTEIYINNSNHIQRINSNMDA